MKAIMWMFAVIFVVSIPAVYLGSYLFTPQMRTGASAPYVLALAGGEKVTRDELQARLAQMQQQAGGPTLSANEFVRYTTLQEAIMEKLLLQEARRRGLRVTGDEIDRQISALVQQTLEKETRGRTPSPRREAELEAFWMGQRGSIERRILFAKLGQEIVGKVTVTPKELQDAFEQIEARHILVSLSPMGKKKRTDEQALLRAQEIHARVAKGEDFAAVARKESDDVGAAQKGGELGWFGRGMMTPEFEKAAFALKPGQISPVTKTPFGYHIIKLEGRRLPADFAKNRKTREKQFLEQKQELLWQSFLEGLRKAGAVKIVDPEFLGVAAMLGLKGGEKEAIEYFKKALRYAPSLGGGVHASILWCLAAQYAALRRWGKAAETYERAIDVATDSLEEIYLSLAQMYISMHKNSEAVEQIRAAVDEAPENASVRNRAQQFYRQLGREDLAKALEKPAERLPQRGSSASEPLSSGGVLGE